MKKYLYSLLVLLLFNSKIIAQDGDNSSSDNEDDTYGYDEGGSHYVDYSQPTYQTFYDELSPFGSWVADAINGNVWIPNAGAGFSPYSSNGHWAYTDYGWTWASDLSWGWGPFHYGNWTLDPIYGWEWIPGTEWAPAWVSWGSYNGYYGWAPLGPGMAYGGHIDESRWCFVPAAHMTEVNIGPYRAGHGVIAYDKIVVVEGSHHYGERDYHSGPVREEFERVSGVKVAKTPIHESSVPLRGQGGVIQVYKPNISPASRATAAPKRITPIDHVAPLASRTADHHYSSDVSRGVPRPAATAAARTNTASGHNNATASHSTSGGSGNHSSTTASHSSNTASHSSTTASHSSTTASHTASSTTSHTSASSSPSRTSSTPSRSSSTSSTPSRSSSSSSGSSYTPSRSSSSSSGSSYTPSRSSSSSSGSSYTPSHSSSSSSGSSYTPSHSSSSSSGSSSSSYHSSTTSAPSYHSSYTPIRH